MDRSFYHFVTKHAFDKQTDGRTDGQTDRRTDERTEFSSLDRVCIPCSAVIKLRQASIMASTVSLHTPVSINTV